MYMYSFGVPHEPAPNESVSNFWLLWFSFSWRSFVNLFSGGRLKPSANESPTMKILFVPSFFFLFGFWKTNPSLFVHTFCVSSGYRLTVSSDGLSVYMRFWSGL